MAVVYIALVMLGAATVALGSDCTSQPAVGLCMARIPRYFYNSTSGSCEHFNYGGCGGNTNNYKTLEECEESCERLSLEDCSAEPEVGMCRAAFPRFYFDIESGTCKSFIYGGCDGNKNNFGDENECQARCGKYVRKELTLEECTAEPVVGKCRARIPAFAFNSRTGKCERFFYGGCGGNANRFHDEETCLGSCGKYAALPDPVPEILCTEEPEVGLCKAAMPRYFWNHRLGLCQPFIYGGCGGNTNNFNSASDCHDACQGTPVKEADCSAQPEGGMCMAYFPSYFYNATSGQCEEFVYGGCGGNSNRFFSLTSCIHTCAQAIPVVDEGLAVGKVGVCSQPQETGLCRAYIPRFFYNEATGSCEKFIYGGCGGNGNNFETVEECHNTCLA